MTSAAPISSSGASLLQSYHWAEGSLSLVALRRSIVGTANVRSSGKTDLEGMQSIHERIRRHVIISDCGAIAVALWVAMSWVRERSAVHSPLLMITSAERETEFLAANAPIEGPILCQRPKPIPIRDHSLQPGVHLSGPSLANLWGKRVATISDFGRYTDALKKTEIVWDENTLYAWVADPQAMVPGTTMTFRGVENDKTRADLIAFLRLALSPGGADQVVKDGMLPASMARGQVPPDLSSLGPNQRIAEIHHCHDAYHVTTANGAKFPFWETNVRLKIDTSPRGPRKGEPVLHRSGMVGDRVSIIFSSLADLHGLIAEKC
jgi:cytochrome c